MSNGSETFHVDIYMKNNRKNLQTPTSNNDAVNKVFCDNIQKKSDNNQLLKLGSGNRWEAHGKTIFDFIKTKYDDEAVTLR